MTQQEYAALVQALTAEAERNSARFRWKVLGVLATGYGFVFGVLALTLLLLAGLAAAMIFMRVHAWLLVKAMIPLAAFAFLLVRALWVRYPEPEGRTLVRTDAPALFDEIERVRTEIGVRRPDEVLVTDDLNASIIQVPALGFVGPTRDVLTVGVQLMQALTPAQFRAVLAHEFGHLSGHHGTFASWIYQVRRMWGTLLEELEKKHGDSGPFASFLAWYSPRFSAHTFVLARQQEYVADRISADATSAPVAGSALVALVTAAGRLDEKLWPGLNDRIRDEAQPPADMMLEIGRVLSGPVPAADAQRWVGAALAIETGLEDTHPALKDRLAALGVTAEQALREGDPGARAVALLGEARAEVESLYSTSWRHRHFEAWSERHRALQEQRKRYDELAARPEASLALEERLGLAFAAEDLYGRGRAQPLFERLLEVHPDHAPALFKLGGWRLEDGDESGLGMLERAAELDEDAVVPSAQCALGYLAPRKREDEARKWMDRAQRQQARDWADRHERELFAPDMPLEPHALADEVIAPLCVQLREEPLVAVAYLVRRHLTIRPAQPQFVLAIRMPNRLFPKVSGDELSQLAQRLAERVALPGPANVVILAGPYKTLEPGIRAVAGANIL